MSLLILQSKLSAEPKTYASCLMKVIQQAMTVEQVRLPELAVGGRSILSLVPISSRH